VKTIDVAPRPTPGTQHLDLVRLGARFGKFAPIDGFAGRRFLERQALGLDRLMRR
jgi:hypothetical protein